MSASGRGGSGTDETVAAPVASAETVDASDASRAPPSHAPVRVTVGGEDLPELVEVEASYYAIRRELARGGMGRILAARDRRLGREVAIKQLLTRDPVTLARFEREMRITARLQHPAIVHVHEAGRWHTGEPFYTMKLVAGRALDRCIGEAADVAARLALVPNVLAVVDALAYAHAEGVIHRDLKPANVLVGDFGETIVIDWGLAKDLRAADEEVESVRVGPFRGSAAGATVDGAVMGTPAYMPPEQANGDPVDARADVYALGALLYHVLAGAPPFTGRTASEILAAVLAGPPRALAAREPDVPIELVAIVEKAMARAVEDRFPSAQEMAHELRRFTAGQLVTSHRYTRWQLVRRWAQRHRGAVAVGSIAVVALAALGIVSIVRIADERDRAEVAAQTTQRALDEATLARARQELDVDPTRAIARLQQLHPGAKEWPAARTVAADAASRGVATHVLHGAPARLLAFSPDGAWLAAVEDEAIRVWDTRTWQSRTLAFGDEVPLALAFGADGVRWATRRGELLRWDGRAPAPALVRIEPPEAEYISAAFSGDAQQVLLVELKVAARLVDVDTGTVRRSDVLRHGKWSTDKTFVVAITALDRVVRIDAATGRVTPFEDIGVHALAVDAARDRVWTTRARPGREPTYVVEELVSGAQLVDLPALVDRLELLPDGRLVAMQRGVVEGAQQPALLVITDTLLAPQELRGHGAQVEAIAVAGDGRIASIDRDGELRIWHAPRMQAARPDVLGTRPIAALCPSVKRARLARTAKGATLSTDGRTLVTIGNGPQLVEHDLARGREQLLGVTDYPDGYVVETAVGCGTPYRTSNAVELVEGDADVLPLLAMSRDRRQFATLDGTSGRRRLVHWDLATRRARLVAHGLSDDLVAMHPDGREIVTSTVDDAEGLRRYDLATGEVRPLAVGFGRALAYAPDGSAFAAAASDRLHVFVRTTDTRPQHTFQLDGTVDLVTFSPDGAWLAAGGDYGALYLWDRAAAAPYTLTGHTARVTSVAFDVPRERFVTTSADGGVRLWDLRTRTSTALPAADEPLTSVVVLDAERVLASGERGTGYLYDLRTRSLRALRGHQVPIVHARLERGHIALLDALSVTTRHPDDLPTDAPALAAWLRAATTLALE